MVAATDQQVARRQQPATVFLMQANPMSELRIVDLANPILNETQRQALAYGETLHTDFDPEGILSDASAATGLKDFGPDDYRERLDLICDEWGNDPELTGLGRSGLRQRLVSYATNRLLIQDTLKRHPQIHDVEISRPVIVAGLPRTGTTHLLNLLAADSRLRSMPLWESYEPLPMPGEPLLPDGTDPRYQRCADAWKAMQETVPHLAAMHPMDPDHIHEEIELMHSNFASYDFEWLAYSPRYRDHYLQMDQLPHYEYMKTALKILQFHQPPHWPRRWVLKSPMHLENLPVLQSLFPDATFVITHRDPVAVIQSTVTMLAYGQRMSRTRVLISELAEYWTARIEHLLRRCVETRHLLPASQSIDVPFHEFMADDMGMVARIYEKAGMALSQRAKEEMGLFLDAHPRGKHGTVVYRLKEDFGVDPDALRERFGFYFDAFPARPEAIRRHT